MFYLIMFSVSLALTLIIELTLAAAFGIRRKEDLLIVLLVNILTNPPAVFLCYLAGYLRPDVRPLFTQIPVEAAVFIAEGFIYRAFFQKKSAVPRPFLLSALLNLCSYGAGLLIRALQ